MSQTPLLSIVAAVYNGEKFLAQFFECIEQQQLDSYELILVARAACPPRRDRA